MTQTDPTTRQGGTAVSGGASSTDHPPARPTLSVVLPTYCEAENLPHLIPAICVALDEAGIAFEVIVVDDDSPDGTERVVADLAADFPVRLLTRRGERGLAGAVLHGFAHARGGILACMDADGSHPPEALPRMVKLIRGGAAEFVLGSRYAAGGSTDEKWSPLRALNSKVATMFSRPFTDVSDPMSGFFAITRERLDACDALSPVGYKIALELLVKSGCRQPVEIPIHFRDRMRGRSKLGLREIINYLRHIARLRRYRLTHRG